jgi:predicted DNA-binding antitoxin AbrB/MazE fold protein
MNVEIEATFENGVFRPCQPVALEEHAKVVLTIKPRRTSLRDLAGMMKWQGDPEVLRRIAEDPEFGIMESP